jgi:flavin reductase (DIM6/NTAB) family NADH-FMN oxidoreductase RutF
MSKIDKASIQKPDKLYFTYPNTVAVICTKFRGKVFVMPSVWQIPLSYSPAIFGILISPKRNTYKKILKTKNFSLNYFSYLYADLITKLGSSTGSEIDKVKKYKLKLLKAKKINSPLLKDSFVSLECKLFKKAKYGDHVLFAAKVVNLTYDKKMFIGNTLNILKANPLLYLGNMTYTTIDSKKKIVCKKEQY